MGFRKVAHTGSIDPKTGLQFELVAKDIAINIINNTIDVKYDKIYLDSDGNEFKREPFAYRVTGEVEIDAWDDSVGDDFETAIVNKMKDFQGIV